MRGSFGLNICKILQIFRSKPPRTCKLENLVPVKTEIQCHTLFEARNPSHNLNDAKSSVQYAKDKQIISNINIGLMFVMGTNNKVKFSVESRAEKEVQNWLTKGNY